jgi:hypothetical protein
MRSAARIRSYRSDGSLAIIRVAMAASEIIFIVDDSPEGGFEARALGQSIFTQADTFEALKDMVRDAVHCHFDESTRPQIIRLHLVRDVVIPA